MKILIINGPNLNMLKYRDSKIYGSKTLEDLSLELQDHFSDQDLEFRQSNHEGEIIDWIHQAIINNYDGLIINPGAFGHYSYAICDALEIFKNSKVEVHLSQIENREIFRQQLVNINVVDKMIIGQGMDGYFMALSYIIETKKALLNPS